MADKHTDVLVRHHSLDEDSDTDITEPHFMDRDEFKQSSDVTQRQYTTSSSHDISGGEAYPAPNYDSDPHLRVQNALRPGKKPNWSNKPVRQDSQPAADSSSNRSSRGSHGIKHPFSNTGVPNRTTGGLEKFKCWMERIRQQYQGQVPDFVQKKGIVYDGQTKEVVPALRSGQNVVRAHTWSKDSIFWTYEIRKFIYIAVPVPEGQRTAYWRWVGVDKGFSRMIMAYSIAESQRSVSAMSYTPSKWKTR
ncbi:MAG: hypothetical protein Q9218_007630 [Villophora microphyllina]